VPLFTKQYKLAPAVGWEGNRRSGVALAMRHRLSSISTYGLNGLGKGDEHSEYCGIIYIIEDLFVCLSISLSRPEQALKTRKPA